MGNGRVCISLSLEATAFVRLAMVPLNVLVAIADSLKELPLLQKRKHGRHTSHASSRVYTDNVLATHVVNSHIRPLLTLETTTTTN